MNNVVLESFINFTDEMDVVEESTKENDDIIKNTTIKIGNKTFDVEVTYDNADPKKVQDRVKRLLSSQPWNKPALWEYLFKKYDSYFKDINSDPYFDGKKITSKTDLMNSITSVEKLVIHGKDKWRDDFSYICGEYWCDDEHGFSINFPNDKIIFAKDGKNVNDEVETGLGGYSAFL